MTTMSLPSAAKVDPVSDVRQRYYTQQIESPPNFAMLMGAIAHQITIHKPKNQAEFALEFFRNLRKLQSSEPAMQMPDLIQLAKKQSNRQEDQSEESKPASPIGDEPPSNLRALLLAYAKECIRYNPPLLIEWSESYFAALASGEQQLKEFLTQEAHRHEPEWQKMLKQMQ